MTEHKAHICKIYWSAAECQYMTLYNGLLLIFSVKVGYVLSRSVMFDSWRPVICDLPGSLSMEFSRQEYWSGLPLPTLGDYPDPRIKPVFLASPALADGFFYLRTND